MLWGGQEAVYKTKLRDLYSYFRKSGKKKGGPGLPLHADAP
jgi:hypothetical protein